MTGGGDYDRHSEYQRRDAASHAELIAAAAQDVARKATLDGVVMADYGCAQGQASKPLLRVAIEQVRAAKHHGPIWVYHNDLLANDWTTFFGGLREEDSYLAVPGGPLTPLVSAVSFYDHVTPPGIVNLGMSFGSLQWLAEPGPGGSDSAIYFDQLDPDARSDMAGQAHRDWSLLLERRADELAPGGRLVLDMMGRRDGHPATGHDIWQQVSSIAEDLVEEGILDGDRLDAYVVPIYERTIDEVRRPFKEGIAERLRLEHLAITDSANPISDRFGADGDASAFARDFVRFFRAFSEPSLQEALDPDGKAMDDLYRQLEVRLRERAVDFTFVVHPITAVIARI